MNATLTSKGQITIPVAIRRKLNLQPGDRLEFDETASFLKATKAIDPDAWTNARKKWKNPLPGLSVSDVLDEFRGPVDPREQGS